MPLLDPRIPLEGRIDGDLMTLLPGDGKRIEWTFSLRDERLPVDTPFVWELEAGVVKSDVPPGHEWCLWQWHAPNEAGLETANSSLMLVMRDGMADLRICHEYSQPFDNSKKQFQNIAERIPMKPGKLYRWHVEAMIAEDGFVKVRRDGVLLVDYVGPVGYHMTGKPYAKAGIYKWAPFEWTGEIKTLVRF